MTGSLHLLSLCLMVAGCMLTQAIPAGADSKLNVAMRLGDLTGAASECAAFGVWRNPLGLGLLPVTKLESDVQGDTVSTLTHVEYWKATRDRGATRADPDNSWRAERALADHAGFAHSKTQGGFGKPLLSCFARYSVTIAMSCNACASGL